MGSCSSCAERDEPDTHPTKFKVKNVDDDGNELESGIMEITEQEIILHTRKRDAVRWPYTCLRRYGYDSNLFSFESGRRCQTGQGIFAFKCARAEEMFNLLQENMQCNRINVREEPTRDRLHSHAESELPPPGYGQQYPRRMSYEESSSHPSSRHPSVGSARLPSVGEESTHPLIVPDEQVHTYVNTSNVHEELASRSGGGSTTAGSASAPPNGASGGSAAAAIAAAAAAAASSVSAAEPGPATGPRGSMEDRNPQVQLESHGAKFILGPTPAQKRELERRRRREHQDGESQQQHLSVVTLANANANAATVRAEDGIAVVPVASGGRKESSVGNSHGASGNNNRLVYENVNGLPPQTPGVQSSRAAAEVQNGNPMATSAAAVVVPVGGRTLQNYENWPTLPSVREEPAVTAVRTPLRNGYHPGAAGLVDTQAPAAGKGHSDLLRKREAAPTVFSFEFRRGSLLQQHHHHHHHHHHGASAVGSGGLAALNYIQVELDEAGSSEGENGGGGGAAPRTPRTPGTPLPQTPTRRTEVYATIDLEKTAAMSSLQRALPRDDGTVRKTRHNSTDPPM